MEAVGQHRTLHDVRLANLRKLVERAKGVLTKTGLSEEEAYLAIQRQAREARVSMRQAAEAIIAKAQPKSPT